MYISVTFDLTDPAWKTQAQRLLDALPVSLVNDAVLTQADASVLTQAEQVKANRQQAAANARAARQAKTKDPEPEPTPDPAEDLQGPAEANGHDADNDDLGLSQPSMSPGEAHDAALALVREIYAANKVKEVKALQKQWGVAKFYDIPLDRAYDFYTSAMKVAVETGIRR